MKFIRNLVEGIGYILFPNTCTHCGCTLNRRNSRLCYRCFSTITPTKHHGNLDHSIYTKRDSLHINFFQYGMSFVYFSKEGAVQSLVHELKYNHGNSIGVWMGEWMSISCKTHLKKWDIHTIVPVPLHKKREQKRSYNQSEFIAQGISTILNIPIETELLTRTRYTISQTKMLDVKKRKENVQGAFSLGNNQKNYENLHILLVDDVLTTGATLSSCAEELSKIHQIKISFLTFALTEI